MPAESVKLIECPRDAWQGLPRQIPTDRKADYLRALIDAGFKHIDAVSLVSPKAVPQMADSEQVLEQLSIPADVEIIGIVVNERGAERAIATGKVTTLGYPCSISETFLRRNQNQSFDENFAILRTIADRASAAGLQTVAYISMAFGNPYGDSWSEAQVADAATKIAAVGVRAISLADTIGVAEPKLIERLLTTVMPARAECEIGVHLHSPRTTARDKILAAYDGACRRFDGALGGLGGCPFAQDDLVGNLPTEEILRALSEPGVEFSIAQNIDAVLAMNAAIASEFSG